MADRVDRICRHTGFLAISDHGLSEELLRDVWAATRAFFDLPTGQKLESKASVDGYPYGYFPMATESLARSRGEAAPPDLKESFNIGPLTRPAELNRNKDTDFCFAPNIWPTQPANIEATWTAYYRAMSELATVLMSLFALALKLPEDFFAPKTSHCISAMRVLNYPRLSRPPASGQLRAGAHTDYGSLTILLPEAESAGLEIRLPSGEWQRVPARRGTFIINLGDLMARWTNDRWVSTMHRVVNAPDAPRRQSIVFFQQPNWDAEISCIPTCLAPGETPKYPSVCSGPYLMDRFTRTVEVQS